VGIATPNNTIIKTTDEFWNLSVTCSQQGCCCDRPTIFMQRRRCPSLKFTQPERGTGSGPVCYELAMAGSYAAHSEMLRTENGMRKGTETAQRDKPLNGSRGEAPIVHDNTDGRN